MARIIKDLKMIALAHKILIGILWKQTISGKLALELYPVGNCQCEIKEQHSGYPRVEFFLHRHNK